MSSVVGIINDEKGLDLIFSDVFSENKEFSTGLIKRNGKYNYNLNRNFSIGKNFQYNIFEGRLLLKTSFSNMTADCIFLDECCFVFRRHSKTEHEKKICNMMSAKKFLEIFNV